MPRKPNRTLRPDEIAHKRGCLDAIQYVTVALRECDDAIEAARVRRRELKALSIKLSQFAVEDAEVALAEHKVPKRQLRDNADRASAKHVEDTLGMKVLGVMQVGASTTIGDINGRLPRLTRSGIRRALARLAQAGRVERPARGFYIRLPEKT